MRNTCASPLQTRVLLPPAAPPQSVLNPNVNAPDRDTPTQVLQPGSTVATALSEGGAAGSSAAVCVLFGRARSPAALHGRVLPCAGTAVR